MSDELAMMRADLALVIHYVRALAETMGIKERLRVADEEHAQKCSELGTKSLWALNGAHGDDDRPTDPAASGSR